MGSPLGSTIVNLFLVYYESKWLAKYPVQFRQKSEEVAPRCLKVILFIAFRSTWLGNLKLLMIYLIVNIIIKDLFTITANIEGGVPLKKSSKTLRKSLFFIKVTASETVFRSSSVKKLF